MQHTLCLADQIHQRALDAAGRYRKAEAELIEILQQAEQHRIFLSKGHSSLFLYVVRELGLSESVAYNLISVSRKAREVPELKTEIAKGAITLSNARKIVPILNSQNKSEWLKKASELSQRQLEKEIVKVRPEAATCERASYVTPTHVTLELGLFENDMKRLRRVQDLLSSSRKRPVSLEETIIALTDEHLNRHDPLERAKRQWVKKGFSQAAITGSSAQYQTESVKIPVSLQVHAAPAKTHAEGSARTEGANDETETCSTEDSALRRNYRSLTNSSNSSRAPSAVELQTALNSSTLP